MTLDDLKDQFNERWNDIRSRVQESPLYNNLKEKYDTLPANTQRGLIIAGVAVVALTLISFPLSYLSTSSEYEAEFKSNRDLLRGLLRASRLASEASALPPSVSAAEIKSQIQNQLSQETLLPEQMGGVQDLEPSALGDTFAPKNVRQEGLGISLKKLNLNQIINLGFSLQALSPSVKMVGLDIKASSPDPHFFDVVYKLVVYSMPGADGGGDDGSSEGQNE